MREVCNAQWDDIQDRLKHLEALIDEQKALLTRAADALERAPVLPPKMIEALIAELRKAAQ